MIPDVMASNIASAGRGSSHGRMKSGESHRTADEGSSYRVIRFSRLLPSDRRDGQTWIGDICFTYVASAYLLSSGRIILRSLHI